MNLLLKTYGKANQQMLRKNKMTGHGLGLSLKMFFFKFNYFWKSTMLITCLKAKSRFETMDPITLNCVS